MQNNYLFKIAIVLWTKQITNYSGKEPIVKSVCTILTIARLIVDSKSGNVCYGR